MKSLIGIVIASMLVGACWSDAAASGRSNMHVSPDGSFSFQVESYGSSLPIYSHRGQSYVEGVYGNTYAVRVFNHTGRRVEAVVTVDGRDVISGQVGNYRGNRGYVIAPYDSVLIEGFRSSWSNVAAFTFTSVGDSYAARMGDATNVGVIGVAVFKEKSYRPVPRPRPYRYDRKSEGSRQGLGTGYGRSSANKSAPSAEPSPAMRESRRSYSMDEMEDDAAQGLGTGYGQDTYSPTTSTKFVRATRRPTAVLSVRYDDRSGLIARGVLPRPYRYRRPARPEPFPETPVFAPPPPPRWWE